MPVQCLNVEFDSDFSFANLSLTLSWLCYGDDSYEIDLSSYS